MKAVHVVLVTIISVLLFSFFVNSVFACDFATDPWFNVEIEVDESSLPDGLVIENGALVNRSNKPLYLVTQRKYLKVDTYKNAEIPVEFGGKYYHPEDKLVSESLYSYHYDPYNSSYEIKDGVQRLIPTGWRKLSDRGWKINAFNLGTLEVDISNQYGDNRPKKVEVPGPKEFTILAYYDGKYIEIEGEINYSLNEGYDPKSFQKGVEFCNSFNRRFNSPEDPVEVLRAFVLGRFMSHSL